MFWGSFSDVAWADVPPCPELAAALDAAVFDELADDDLLELAAARHRQIAAAQHAQLCALAELARRRLDAEPGSETAKSVKYLDSEIACRLRITERAAGQLLFLALALTCERAATGETLRTGLIDLGKASVFAHELDGIDEELAAQIEGKLLPQAPALTSGQLRLRIRRMIERADPEAAARRRREAIASRDVTRWQNRDRTHTVAIRNVNGTTSGRIVARIAARARALKNDGDERPLHQIRADLASAILLGEYPNGYQPGVSDQPEGPDQPDQPEHPDHPDKPDASDAPNEQTGDGCDGDGPGAADVDPAYEDPPDEDCANDDHADPDLAESEPAGSSPPHDESQPGCTWPRTVMPPAAEEDRPPGEPAIGLPFDDGQRIPGTAFPQPRLGHWEPWHSRSCEDEDGGDEDPEVCRQREAAVRVAAMAARSLAGLFDPFGPRPRAPAAVLACHAAKIAQRLAGAKSPACVRTTLPGGTVIHGTGTYRPSPSIQRNVARRDQRCQFPSCNRSAQFCDQDHTVPYHCGKVTCPCNIVTLCRHHHILKQDKNWRVFHPWPGVLIWITPAGQWHVTTNDNLPTLDVAA